MSRRSLPFAFLLTCLLTLAACADGARSDAEPSDASQVLPGEDAQVPLPDAASDGGGDDGGSADDAGAAPDAGDPDPDPEPDSGEIDPGEVVYDVEVASTWPAADAREVPVTASISVTFNQAMFPNSLTAAASNADDRDHNVVLAPQGSRITPVAVTKRDSSDKFTFVYTPNAPLAAKTTYTLTIRGGGDEAEENDAARSQRRTRMAEDFEFSFTTASADAPPTALTVTSISPADGSAEVDNATRVTVSFNQPIQSATLYLVPEGQGADPKRQGTFWVSDSPSFLFPEPGTLTLNGEMTAATFALAPGSALQGGTTYYVGVKGCADTPNPANSPCLRALSGARLEEDFTAAFTTRRAPAATIGALYELAATLESDSASVATNLRIEGATMTYYRDVSDNEGFFMQRQEMAGGEEKTVGIYVNTLGKHPPIPVWPMFESAQGWTSDGEALVEDGERALFAGYPVIDIDVTSVGTYQGMAYVKTDGYPAMRRVEGAADRTLADLLGAGEVATFSRAELEALQAAGAGELYKKVVVGEEHLGRLVMVEGKARYTGSSNSNSRIWFDLRWGTNASGDVIVDNIHKVRLLLTQAQMDLLGLQRVTNVDQATLRVLAPLQKGAFNKEELFYVQPAKISSVECTASQSGKSETCGARARTPAEIEADPELMRDVVRIAATASAD